MMMAAFDEPDPPGVVDVKRLIDTYPRWKRVLAWVVWKTPIKLIARRMNYTNPYRMVVRVIDLGLHFQLLRMRKGD